MKYILMAILLAGCSPQTAKIVEDVVEGEAEVVEKIIEDTAVPSRPQVTLVK